MRRSKKEHEESEDQPSSNSGLIKTMATFVFAIFSVCFVAALEFLLTIIPPYSQRSDKKQLSRRKTMCGSCDCVNSCCEEMLSCLINVEVAQCLACKTVWELCDSRWQKVNDESLLSAEMWSEKTIVLH